MSRLQLEVGRDGEVLTLYGDVKGAAGSPVLVLSQAAVLAVPLGCDLADLQHRELVGCDGAHQLSVFQPGEGGGGASLSAAVQVQSRSLLNRHGVID